MTSSISVKPLGRFGIASGRKRRRTTRQGSLRTPTFGLLTCFVNWNWAEYWRCVSYATRTLLSLSSEEEQRFSQRLRTWDKRAYIGMGDHYRPTLEKYLLITYADEHLELPPLNLNNSF